jgi:hypothetical protein
LKEDFELEIFLKLNLSLLKKVGLGGLNDKGLKDVYFFDGGGGLNGYLCGLNVRLEG